MENTCCVGPRGQGCKPHALKTKICRHSLPVLYWGVVSHRFITRGGDDMVTGSSVLPGQPMNSYAKDF